MPPKFLPVLLLTILSCRTGRPYPSPHEPRYAGGRAVARAESQTTATTLVVVSFNIAFARSLDSAIALLRAEPALRDPDLLLLQEMDDAGTRRIAEALGMAYVYYPALHHRRTRRDFGNAVLSRWPIVADEKLILPHRSWYAGTHRIATAVTIRVGSAELRVYSTHLGTPADVLPRARRNQLRAILDDAARYPRAIIAGDMNSGSIGAVARERGYQWITERGPRTTAFGRWDHIFLKGLTASDSAGSGTVLEVRGSSDHRPVWARVVVH